MFVRSASFCNRTRQQKLDRSSSPSPWTSRLADEGVAIFSVQCAGTVNLTDENNIDLSYKKQFLQFIHRCQIEHRLPKKLTGKSLVNLSITTKDIQISNTNQVTIHTIPSHHVITCYYVEYEGDHIFGMKYVCEKENHSSVIELIIFLLNDRYDADELCSAMDYCLRNVYIQNEKNSELIRKLSLLTVSIAQNVNLNSSFDSTTSSIASTVRSSSVASNSSNTTVTPTGSISQDDQSSDSHRKHRHSRRSKKSNSPNKSSKRSTEKIIQNYLLKLELELKTEELMGFGKLLIDWQSNNTDVKFFVKGTARLYGKSRLNLLDGLHNFLPTEEQNWFIDYLNELKRASPSIFSDDQSWEQFHSC